MRLFAFESFDARISGRRWGMVGHAFPGPLARGDGVPVESYEQSGESVMLAVGGDGAAEQGAVLALAYVKVSSSRIP